MSNADWIDAPTACAALGIRRQSLYAYVSRKLLRTCSDVGDPRRSLYSRQDVEQLAARNRRPRARAEVAARAIRWGDPVLETAVSGVRDGQLWFGDRLAAGCADTMSLEEVAAHHWRVAQVASPAAGDKGKAAKGDTPFERALRYLSRAAVRTTPMQGKSRKVLAAEGAVVLAGLTAAILKDREDGPVHIRVAKAWRLDREARETVRKCVIMLSDHELNPSTFAVRVCASTAPSLAAALLAGLATLSGPRHGGVADKARQALDAASMGDEAFAGFMERNADLTPHYFGYGHPLYPEGDPRAAYLLAALGEKAAAVRHVRATEKRLGLPANVDAALAAVAKTYGLPADAAFSLFAIGRVTGWIAHAIEQVETGQIIRPRAHFKPA